MRKKKDFGFGFLSSPPRRQSRLMWWFESRIGFYLRNLLGPEDEGGSESVFQKLF